MLEIGSLLDGKYRILNEVGRGGMSVVYMAIVEKANKTWAVKEIRKDGVTADFEIVKQGLLAETDILKRLNHPYLPSIIDVIDRDDSFLIVMDYVEGNSLGQKLKEEGAQPQSKVIRWARQLCDVLGYLHSRKPPIIYRDLKPANIMLKPDGNITLIDFGTAREFKETNIEDTTCLGTIGYAAPEQFGGHGQTDARTDIYNLGATLYHLITDQNPSEPPYMIQPIRQINPQLSPGLEMIIAKCTQPNPEDRYQNAAELMYALDHYEKIDWRYRGKIKRRLVGFATACLLTVGFTTASIVAYRSAQSKQGDNYQSLLAQASSALLSQEDRQEIYLEAIATDPSRTTAYLDMTHMFLNQSANDSEARLTKAESAVYTQLEAGLDTGNGHGASRTVYPLQTLASTNPGGYEDVSYEIALAYWYDYEVESDREMAAQAWFERSAPGYPIADVYVQIANTKQEIRRYREQSRTERMYESYESLWETQKSLFQTAEEMNDNDTKLLVWPEIVETIQQEAPFLLNVVTANEMYTLLEDISTNSTALKNTSNLQEVTDLTSRLQTKINDAYDRIQAAVEEEERDA